MHTEQQPPDIFDIASPRADALIESLRNFGYSPQAAIADLIDNSITANSTNIWVDFIWGGSNSYAVIRDDGDGMSEVELVEAMRPGTNGPRAPRRSTDLGRFGLGLKTASFSQCRRLSVISREKDGVLNLRCWDLDYVSRTNEWRLLKSLSKTGTQILSSYETQGHGTVVLWEILDRLIGEASVDDDRVHKRFLRVIEEVEQHLAITFHRFIAGRRQLKLWVNGNAVTAWDPFLTGATATQRLATESVCYLNEKIVVQPFILPHHSKLDTATHTAGGGQRGWNAHQGFYVYRNERLLIAGDWLGLPFLKEEHYKLARIQVDIPNSLDEQWHIDVRKARARLPGALRDDFKRIAQVTRERAANIYRHRGKIVAYTKSQDFTFPWERGVHHGKVFYRINRSHPLVEQLLSNAGAQQELIRVLLRLLEETVPVPLIAIDHSERPAEQASPFETTPVSEVRKILETVFAALKQSGLSSARTRERLMTMEPFHHLPELVEEVCLSADNGDMR